MYASTEFLWLFASYMYKGLFQCHLVPCTKHNVQCLNSWQLQADYEDTDHRTFCIDFKLCFPGGFCSRKLKWSLISQEHLHSPQRGGYRFFLLSGFLAIFCQVSSSWQFCPSRRLACPAFSPRTRLHISRLLCPADFSLHRTFYC